MIENTIIEDINDESNDEFPSLSENHDKHQSIKNEEEKKGSVRSSAKLFEEIKQERMTEPKVGGGVLCALNTNQISHGEDQKKSFNWLEQFRNSSALVSAFQLKQLLPPSTGGEGVSKAIIPNTPGFNNIINGLVNKTNNNDEDIDITDSQKGLLLDLEHFMLQF